MYLSYKMQQNTFRCILGVGHRGHRPLTGLQSNCLQAACKHTKVFVATCCFYKQHPRDRFQTNFNCKLFKCHHYQTPYGTPGRNILTLLFQGYCLIAMVNPYIRPSTLSDVILVG